MIFPANRRVGKYEIGNKLGHGGMAHVYQAKDSEAGDRLVALKVIEHADTKSREAIVAERRGAELQRRLAKIDRRFADVYETGDVDGYFIVAMEYVPGRDLAEHIAVGRIRPERAAEIAIEVACALDAAHSLDVVIDGRECHGVVHGDIKPTNIRIDPGGHMRILDFGIAKALSLERRLTGNDFRSSAYASPERLVHNTVNEQSDLWALAVTLYEMVAGHQPYRAQQIEQVERMIVSQARPEPLPHDCPAGLRRILVRAMQPRPEDRYASAKEFAAALRSFREGIAAGDGSYADPEKTHPSDAPGTAGFNFERPPVIGDLRANRRGDVVTLTGVWPLELSGVVIVWRQGSAVGEMSSGLGDGRREVTRAEYELRRGSIDISGVPPGRHYFSVFPQGIESVCYSPAFASECVDISYRMITRRQYFVGEITEAWLELQASIDGVELPPVRAIMAGTFPLRPEDGRLIASPHRVRFVGGKARIDLPIRQLSGFVRLFFANENDAREFGLLGNERELRV